jgi:hypothetical protein
MAGIGTGSVTYCDILPKERVAREKYGTIAMVARKDGDITGKIPREKGW